MARSASTPCDWPGGCDRSPITGEALFRTNPKGETGVFMCAEHATARTFEPLQVVTMYQARCTSCGYLVEDYGDFSCMPADDVINEVRNAGWFERTRTEPSPRPDNPHAKVVHTEELLCPDCQKCEVCGGVDAHADELDEHLVCAEHEDHDFGTSPK